MMQRIKLLQEHALLLRCHGCGKLLIAAANRRPARLGCVWKAIFDADLRVPLRSLSRKMARNGKLACKKCGEEKPVNWSQLSDDQLDQLEKLTNLLLGVENVPDKHDPDKAVMANLASLLGQLQ
jgi:hypothetical protein